MFTHPYPCKMLFFMFSVLFAIMQLNLLSLITFPFVQAKNIHYCLTSVNKH